MSAQPAEDYTQSPQPRIPFRPPGDVVHLSDHRPQAHTAPPPPEYNHHEPPRNITTNSGPNSGTGITLGDIPGDWASVTAVWTGTPAPLHVLVEQVRQARQSEDRKAVAAACWALLVLIPRALLHLASWALAHPLRTAVAALLLAVLIATATH